LNNIEQSDIELFDVWEEKTNIFIGAELTPVPNGDYNGEISDVSYIYNNLKIIFYYLDYRYQFRSICKTS